MSSPIIAREIETAIRSEKGPISFFDFMRIALYHPGAGYYSRPRERVGFAGSTDFFTATTTGAVFTDLVVEACATLVAPRALTDFQFVEVGAEPEGGLLGKQHPFGGSSLLRRDDPIAIPGRAVVFSNELFDAQPFHRLVFTGGCWREIGVDLIKRNLVEAIMPEFSTPVHQAAGRLPKESVEGYHLDLPLAAVHLLEKLVTASSWRGLLILFDYGKSWRELTEVTPQGTARAYRRHRQSNNLLADPGEQDLTCHICWDWLEEILAKNGFENRSLQSQEAFFVTHAAAAIERIITARPGQFDPRRQTLQQLLHPGNMGQKFQVLSARR